MLIQVYTHTPIIIYLRFLPFFAGIVTKFHHPILSRCFSSNSMLSHSPTPPSSTTALFLLTMGLFAYTDARFLLPSTALMLANQMLSDETSTAPAVSYSAVDSMANDQSSPSDDLGFSVDDIVSQIRLSMPFKLHVLTALGATCLAVIIWFFVGIAKSWFPWFLIVALVFIVTVAVHYYIILRNKEFLQCHTVICVALNIILALFWLNDNSNNKNSTCGIWFVYPLCATATIWCAHYLFVKRTSTKQYFITLHGVATAIFSVMFFFIWYNCPPENDINRAWFVVVDIILVMLYLAHQSLAKGLDWFVLHAKMFGCGSLLLFSIWLVFCNNKFPWFVFPIAAWAGLLVFHMFKTTSISERSEPSLESQN